MPLGLDTPSTFGVAFLVLLPALTGGYFQRRRRDHEQAMEFAWHVGLMILVLSAIFKIVWRRSATRCGDWCRGRGCSARWRPLPWR